MKRLAILGASGHGRVVAEIAECCCWDEVVFFDDNLVPNERNGYWVIEGDSYMLRDQLHRFAGVTVAIGNNSVRAEKLAWLDGLSAPVVTLVHPSAIISRYAEFGLGTVIMPGVIVNASSRIGAGVILNTGCSVDHDCIIEDFVHISPNATLCGGVFVLGFRQCDF